MTERTIASIVYDLDSTDEECDNHNCLKFESRFESGNLHRSVYVGNNVYFLFIRPDVGSNLGQHHQWFYFEVSNTKKDEEYTFYVINYVKPSSSFEDGMQPVFYSTKSSEACNKGWHRHGYDISYFKHVIPNPSKENANYSALKFKINFPYDDDECYLAYHFPYTYTDLQVYLDSTSRRINVPSNDIYYERQAVCYTDNNNVVDCLTITNMYSVKPIENRTYIFITARISIDLHGHSRKNNIFVFGCPNANNLEKLFTFSLKQSCDFVDYSNSRFKIQKSKRTTARVVLWKELNIPCSVTIETSYLGATEGNDALYRAGNLIGYGVSRFSKILDQNSDDSMHEYISSVVLPDLAKAIQ
ncbi:hypothetical protein ROZALSC1DRAFT_29771, partial [Rozella allomycis CSF55]